MLGHYENFPKIIHGVARFTHKTSRRKIQKAIVSVFHRLNQERCELKEIVYSSSPSCEVDFEFGIGENSVFTYLDENELSILEAEIAKKTLMFLDFLCVLQYHIVQDSGKRVPLKFDYYMLRFEFDRNYMEFLVSHERGPQHVHVEDLIDFLTRHLERALADRYSTALKLEGTQTV